MNCPLCGNLIPKEGPYTILQPKVSGATENLDVCGRCFLLVSIKDLLKEIKDGND